MKSAKLPLTWKNKQSIGMYRHIINGLTLAMHPLWLIYYVFWKCTHFFPYMVNIWFNLRNLKIALRLCNWWMAKRKNIFLFPLEVNKFTSIHNYQVTIIKPCIKQTGLGNGSILVKDIRIKFRYLKDDWETYWKHDQPKVATTAFFCPWLSLCLLLLKWNMSKN